MKRKSPLPRRLALLAATAIVIAAAVLGLARINERMIARYQAVGLVVAPDGRPLSGVEAALLLSPPPPEGPQRDALFEQEGLEYGRLGREGSFTGAVGPAVGLSDSQGAFIVRVTGRLGPAHAIRLGFDRTGRPPFETAWLVLRRPGYPDVTRTLSLLGWRTAPPGWGVFANRLPVIVLE
ncbi:MAG: hypothetical protein V3571_04880 [Pseudodesulfovibrio sp.]